VFEEAQRMKPVRAVAVHTVHDKYDLYIYELIPHRPFAQFRSHKSPHWTHIGSPIEHAPIDRIKKITDLATDCINAIILLGGPVTRIESLERDSPEGVGNIEDAA
jgi:hypothetical protein